MLTAAGAGEAVAIGDPAGMIAAVQTLRDQPTLRQQRAQAGRAYAEQHLQIEQNVQAYLTILNEVL